MNTNLAYLEEWNPETEDIIIIPKTLKQRIAGIVLLLIAIMIPLILDGDCTADLIIVPLAVWMITSKNVLLS